MNFETHNTTDIDVDGSWLTGELKADYKELKSLFGKPIESDNGKTDVEWHIKFSDGTIATIYNWKNGRAYLGDSGLSVEQIKTWHVGGFATQALVLVQLSIEMMRDAKPKDKIEEALGSAFDMMDSIRANKGDDYGLLVEIAMLTMKRKGMIEMLLDLLEASTGMPKHVQELLLEADTQMSVKIISAACQASKHKFDKQGTADELMEWASQMIKAEESGVKELFKDKKK